jgi:RNA polymerase sigma-B factor
MLFARYGRTRAVVDRDALFERFLPLARHLARRYRGSREIDDLEQVACLGLVNAIERFDPARGAAFTSFAVPTIAGELQRYFRDHGWTLRVPRSVQELALRLDQITDALTQSLGRFPTATEVADAAGAELEDVLEARASATAHWADSLDAPSQLGGETVGVLRGGDDPGYARVEHAALISELLSVLPYREQLIVRLRFYDECTQAEIGELLGLSQMHVSRLLRKAMLQLTDAAADE